MLMSRDYLNKLCWIHITNYHAVVKNNKIELHGNMEICENICIFKANIFGNVFDSYG